jgi:hypothetical protein
MPGPHPTRWPIFLACSSLFALGCSSDPHQGSDGGSLSLNLVLAGGVVINEVDYEISGNGIEPIDGTINTSAPGASASVEVFGLPPAEDYVVELEATSEDGEVTCRGSAEFDVEIGVSTDVMMMLNCKLPVDDGAVRVNGKFNICAQLHKVVVSPLQTSIGNDIDLSALGMDEEGDPITYTWTGTGGTIADANAASTTYTCGEVGEQTITITISDDNFEYCMDDWTVPVTCVDVGLCDDVDCDDGNECTDNDCSPVGGICINDPVEDGTECEDGGGTCASGECVGVDRCEDVDCTSGNECVEDGTCDHDSGMCIDGANRPPGTPCGDGRSCDGGGNCKINTCAEVRLVVASPLQTSVGNDINLSAMGHDENGDLIAYLWTGAGGSIANPNAASTTYTCGEVGEQTITITISDDDFEHCTDAVDVPVTCIDD